MTAPKKTGEKRCGTCNMVKEVPTRIAEDKEDCYNCLERIARHEKKIEVIIGDLSSIVWNKDQVSEFLKHGRLSLN